MNSLTTWACATAIAFVLAAGCALDGPEDHSADWAESDAIAALQATEAGTVRRQAAGQRLCTEARGPNSEARWTADGDLVCTTRRGLVAVATGDL